MSTLKVDSITNNGSAVDLTNGAFQIGGNDVVQGYTESATEPSSPTKGDLWWDTANEVLYQYLNGEFKEIGIAVSVVTWYGDTGIIFNGNLIDQINIASAGNATSTGFNPTNERYGLRGASDSSRGVFGGGLGLSNIIEYITFSSLSNGTDFGDLVTARTGLAAISDGTYALFHGGYDGGTSSLIDYVTIQTTGNASTFGNTSNAGRNHAGVNDATRGVFNTNYTNNNTLEYVTVATTSNAASFGSLLSNNWGQGGCSDQTRGVFAGRYNNINSIDYITIQTLGNSTEFGDLTVGRAVSVGMSNGVRGVFCGGWSSNNVIDYITIQTTGDATDFGDLTANTASDNGAAAASGT